MINQALYRRWARVYDALLDRPYRRGRRRALKLLALRSGERLLIPGVGTGLDLPAIPPVVLVLGIDVSEAMLARARRHRRPGIELAAMDAQALTLPDASVDAILCNLVLTVVPDGPAAMREAWRVLRPGGRLVVFDKFLPADGRLTAWGRLVGALGRRVGTDVNRRLGDLSRRCPAPGYSWTRP